MTMLRIKVILVTLNRDTLTQSYLAFFMLLLLDSSFYFLSDYFKLIKNVVFDLLNIIMRMLMLLDLFAFRLSRLLELSAYFNP